MKAWHVLITGGSAGIGLSIAERLVAEGAVVHLTGRKAQPLEAARRRLGDRAHIYAGDVGDAGQRISVLRTLTERSGGRLDGLVLNAAKYGYKPLLQLADTEVEAYFRTNTMSLVPWVNGCHPLLLRGEGKAVLFISSTLSERPVPGTGPYAASKAAMNILAKCYALELARDQIRVNAILPGVVDTGIHEPQGPTDPSRAEKMADLAKIHPLGRVGFPIDIAEAALFLLSRKAEWITGSLFTVDGGVSIA